MHWDACCIFLSHTSNWIFNSGRNNRFSQPNVFATPWASCELMKKSSPILSASLSSVKMITFTAYQCGGVAMALQGQKSNNIFHNREDVSSNNSNILIFVIYCFVQSYCIWTFSLVDAKWMSDIVTLCDDLSAVAQIFETHSSNILYKL